MGVLKRVRILRFNKTKTTPENATIWDGFGFYVTMDKCRNNNPDSGLCPEFWLVLEPLVHK